MGSKWPQMKHLESKPSVTLNNVRQDCQKVNELIMQVDEQIYGARGGLVPAKVHEFKALPGDQDAAVKSYTVSC